MIVQYPANDGREFTPQFTHDALDDNVFDVMACLVNHVIGKCQALGADLGLQLDEFVSRRPARKGARRLHRFGQDRQIIIFVGLRSDFSTLVKCCAL